MNDYPYTCPWCFADLNLGDTLIGHCPCGSIFDGRRWPQGGWFKDQEAFDKDVATAG